MSNNNFKSNATQPSDRRHHRCSQKETTSSPLDDFYNKIAFEIGVTRMAATAGVLYSRRHCNQGTGMTLGFVTGIDGGSGVLCTVCTTI